MAHNADAHFVKHQWEDMSETIYAGSIGHIVSALRPSTRFWYDILTPVTMLLLIGGPTVPRGPLLLVLAAVTSFHAGQTLFNDVADVAVDRVSYEVSRKERGLVRGVLSPRLYLVLGWVLITLSLLITLALPWVCLVVFAIALPVVLAYNFEPTRLSGRPLITQIYWPITWALIYFYSAGALNLKGWSNGLTYLMFVMLFMGIGEGLAQDIRDADNDAAGGRITTVVHYGVPHTAIAMWVAFLLSLFSWLLFVFERTLGQAHALVTGAMLIAWVFYSLAAVIRLQRGFSKRDGKLLHVGAICTFTSLNLLTILALVFGD